MSPANPDSDRANALLGKADALIRRHRPDGIDANAEELPLLTDVLEDLAIKDEGDFNVVPPGGFNQAQVDILIQDAVDRAQRDVLRHQERLIAEAVTRTQSEAAAAQQQAFQAAVTQALHEGRQEGQTQGFAEGLARGRAEGQGLTASAVSETKKDAQNAAVMQFSEQLIELDAYIAQSMDAWLNKELPQLLSKELSNLTERLKSTTAAHMRATLLPDISEKLSQLLEIK